MHTSDIFNYKRTIFPAEICIFHGIHAHFGHRTYKLPMQDRSKLIGHLAAFTAYLIFGINVIVCKDLMGGHFISPIAIFTLRSLGAGLLFWILSLFLPREKVEPRDSSRYSQPPSPDIS